MRYWKFRIPSLILETVHRGQAIRSILIPVFHLDTALCTSVSFERHPTFCSTMSYRKVDASDPRRPELVRPLALPKSWNADDLDVYASFLGSVSMMSGAAMLTRAPYIAYAGLVFACAHIAHDKPFKSKKTSDVATGGPYMSLM